VKKALEYILFFIIVGYFFNSDYFERNFFINEFLSLLGLLVFLATIGTKNGGTIKMGSYKFWVFLFLSICIVHLIASVPRKTSWYFYARNTVIFYSVFSFFLGHYFFTAFDRILTKIKGLLSLFVAYALIFKNVLLARYSGPLLYPVITRRIGWGPVMVLVLLIFVHGILYDALSITILAPMLLLILLSPNYKTTMFIFGIGFIVLVGFIISIEDSILLYKTGGYRYFGNVHKVYETNKLLEIDHNTSWRIILWYRFVVERFPENLLGIGFGTPLLPYRPGLQTAMMVDDQTHAHVSGAHNTFITLFVRLGLAGLLVLVAIIKKVFKEFYRLRQLNKNSSYLKYYLIWFFIFVLGLFNLALESPLRASIFWISLGFLSKIKSRTLKNVTS